MDSWFQSRPGSFTVKNLMDDVTQWFNGGYIHQDIWAHLESYVTSDLLSVSFSQVTLTSGKTVVKGTSSLPTTEGKEHFYVMAHSHQN